MYADFWNQFYHLMHYGLSFLLIGIIAPFLVFSRSFKRLSDQWVSNYIRSVFVVIVLGYFLVLTKLFEVISLLIIFIIVLMMTHLTMWKKVIGEHSFFRLLFRFFDMLDGLVALNKKAYTNKAIMLNETIKMKWESFYANKGRFFQVLILVIVLGYALYIRFYDAVIHAAPALSDSYVTLAWMKYINQRILFHDGIYPQGFHIYLATLSKFAAIDGLYILKYTGPLNTFFIVLGFYYSVKRLTGSFIAGLTSAIIYGLLGTIILYGDVERQIGTNSQEFAFVFIFPTLYFLFRFVISKEKSSLVTGMLGLCVVGLVHSLAFAYIGLAVMALITGTVIINGRDGLPTSLKLVYFSLSSVIVSLIPLGLGYLLGSEVHSSSADYLTSTTKGTVPLTDLHVIDYVTLLCLPFCAALSFMKRNPKSERILGLFATFIGSGFFLLYFLGGKVTHSLLISSRAIDLWALTIPFCIGVGLFGLGKCLPKTAKIPMFKWGFTIIIVLFATLWIHPSPINAYKMERDIQVEEYLKISNNYTNKEWMIVSQQEGYAKVLGRGVHMYLRDFLKRYDPKKGPLTKRNDGKLDYDVPPDVFVFHEKKIFRVSETNSIYSILKSNYEQREIDNRQFDQWIKVYKAHHYPYEIIYQDENLAVYHFQIPEKKQKNKKRFWE